MVKSFEELTPLQREHHEIAEGFGRQFSTAEFKSRFQEMFPERTPGSILPNDYAYNNGNDLSYREQYPWFLEKIARAQFRFIGLDAGEKHKGRSASPEDFAYWWVNIKADLRT